MVVVTNLVFLVDINDSGYDNWKRFPKFPIDGIINFEILNHPSNDEYGITSKGCLSINKLGHR